MNWLVVYLPQLMHVEYVDSLLLYTVSVVCIPGYSPQKNCWVWQLPQWPILLGWVSHARTGPQREAIEVDQVPPKSLIKSPFSACQQNNRGKSNNIGWSQILRPHWDLIFIHKEIWDIMRRTQFRSSVQPQVAPVAVETKFASLVPWCHGLLAIGQAMVPSEPPYCIIWYHFMITNITNITT